MTTRLKTSVLEDTSIERQFKQDLANTTGLTYAITAGFYTEVNLVYAFPDTTFLLTDEDVNYIYIDISGTPTLTSSVTIPVLDSIMIAAVTCTGGAITAVTEWRTRRLFSA